MSETECEFRIRSEAAASIGRKPIPEQNLAYVDAAMAGRKVEPFAPALDAWDAEATRSLK